MLLLGTQWAGAEDEAAPPPAPPVVSDNDAAESDGEGPSRAWNEYDGRYFTLRLGGGVRYDTAGYAQDDASDDQLSLTPTDKLRDFRFLLKGRLKFLPRVSYTVGYTYDPVTTTWGFRQTGFMVDVPELLGTMFVGRTTEGFSTSKLMSGYNGWALERAAINDAFLPILADGIKWTGNIPDGTLVYSLGWFSDSRSENESFGRNDMQVTARAVWLPFTGRTDDLLHLALEARWGQADDRSLQYRAKPEVSQAQSYVIDTGAFPAEQSLILGAEAYYRPGPLMFGMEYFVNQVTSREAHDPLFHGGEIFVSWLLTGETRPYNASGGYFKRVVPDASVFEGGLGAWEAVLRFTYADLDDQAIEGGRFWRITPMMNWHLSDGVRLEFAAGYGVLERFGVRGGTVFAQTRVQFQL